MAKAIFNNTNLEKTVIETSFSNLVDPKINPMKKAKFLVLGVLGLLNKHDIVIEK